MTGYDLGVLKHMQQDSQQSEYVVWEDNAEIFGLSISRCPYLGQEGCKRKNIGRKDIIQIWTCQVWEPYLLSR